MSADDAGDLAPIDEIWEHLKWPGAAMMVRDADNLRQHLALSGGRRYSLLVARRHRQPIGYLLYRTLRHALNAFGAARVGSVSDYLVDEADVATLRVLVGEACRRWSAERVKLLMVLSAAEGHRGTFSRLGLLRPVTVGGRLLGGRMTSRSMHQPEPGTEGRWHLTFADNDTDLILGAARENSNFQRRWHVRGEPMATNDDGCFGVVLSLRRGDRNRDSLIPTPTGLVTHESAHAVKSSSDSWGAWVSLS